LENVLRFHPQQRNEENLKRARQLLEGAGLGNAEHRHPKQLSTGMRRRVELSRALFIDDEFFVADEPFTGLDVQTRTELYDVWLRLRAANPRTGIICTHDPIEAVTLCDAVIVLLHRASLSLRCNPNSALEDGSYTTSRNFAELISSSMRFYSALNLLYFSLIREQSSIITKVNR
jgi:ABC-type nitrate/sulfonate/bicarbonate transport system ATPase subunit